MARLRIGIALGLLLSVPAHAGSTAWFEPQLQFRPRYEGDTQRDGDDDSGWVHQATHRARLGFAVGWGPIHGRILVQDVRAWGEELDTRRDTSADGFDLSWAVVAYAPRDDVWVRLGRQEIVLHSQRLLARAGWRQPGRHFDGLRAAYYARGWGAEAMALLVRDGDERDLLARDQVRPGTLDRSLWVLRGGHDDDRWTAEGVVLVDRRGDVDWTKATFGLFSDGEIGLWQWKAEAYGQAGSVGTRSVRAWMASGQLGLQAPGGLRIGGWVGHDVLSGDPSPDDGVHTAFDTLYGADHRHYGTLDIAWLERAGEADGRGLHDTHLGLGLSPTAGVDLRLDGHLFAPYAPRGASRWLGTEVDLRVDWRPHRWVTVSGGGMVFAPLDGLARDPDGLLWLQVDLQVDGLRVGLGG